jgi:hypothetical protein
MESKIHLVFITSILAFALIAGVPTTVDNVYAQEEEANQSMQDAGQSANQSGQDIQQKAGEMGSKVTEGAKDLAGNIGDKLQDLGK